MFRSEERVDGYWSSIFGYVRKLSYLFHSDHPYARFTILHVAHSIPLRAARQAMVGRYTPMYIMMTKNGESGNRYRDLYANKNQSFVDDASILICAAEATRR